MADDRMKNDAQKNMGGGAKDQDYGQQGQQSPGRAGQGGQQSGQQAGGQQGGSQQSGGQFGGQKGTRNMEDDEDFNTGSSGQAGGMNRGGQNR